MPSLKAIDVATDTTGKAHALQAAGIQAVGIYLRADRCSGAMVRGLKSVGIRLWSIWEKGLPTGSRYFNPAQGLADAGAAVTFAQQIGQPSGSQIFFAVDYDATVADMQDHVIPYFEAVHGYLRQHSYLAAVYGSGLVIRMLVDAGLAHSGQLAGAPKWQGFDPNMPGVSIMQGPTTAILGLVVDTDTVVDMSATWGSA